MSIIVVLVVKPEVGVDAVVVAVAVVVCWLRLWLLLWLQRFPLWLWYSRTYCVERSGRLYGGWMKCYVEQGLSCGLRTVQLLPHLVR